MKKLFTFFALVVMLSSCDILKEIPGATTGSGAFSSEEAATGIRQALDQGTGKAVLQLHSVDGFFSSAIYKILLPPEAKKIENTLRNLGMNSLVDKAILQINRGAEDAVGFAKPIFVDAIKGMTISDAINIIRGSDTSATNYFRVKTNQKLIAAFMPVIKSSLDKVSATQYYGDMINTYNSFPTTINKLNPDLPSYVTLRATNSLFDLIAKEEKNIRVNPVARTTEILKKVFGRS